MTYNTIEERLSKLRAKLRGKQIGSKEPYSNGLTKAQQRAIKIDRMYLNDPYCSICRNPFKNNRDMHLDHDHRTEEDRGLLCHNCNVGLGNFKDRIDYLYQAIDYLKQHANKFTLIDN